MRSRVCRSAAVLAALVVCALPSSAWGAGAGGAGPNQLTPQTAQQFFDAAARRATAIANRTQAAARVRAGGGVQVFPQPLGGTKWRVGYARGGDRILEVDVDLSGSRVQAVWGEPQANFPMARGYRGWFGAHVTRPWVWLPLCALFLLLFVDRRRLRRLVHLDLLAILGFGVSQWFFQRGNVDLSVPLSYIPLVYLLVRMAMLARRPLAPGDALAPAFGPRVLVAVLVLACAFRIGLNVSDSNNKDYVGWGKLGSTVVDVGYAGVLGADRLQHGLELYTPTAHLDTYGPLNYVAYVPFERIWPYKGRWDSLPAAHAAAITFDLLTIVGLFVLGLRLRRGREGRVLGLALACAWAVCPYTSYVLNANTNDGLVALALVWALVAFRSSFLSGLIIGLGTAAKFIPAALLPGLVRLRRKHGLRDALICGAAFLAVVLGAAFAFAPPEGVSLVWKHTVARQAGSASPFSVWGMWNIDWLRKLLELALFAAAVAAAFGRDRIVPQAAAIGAVLILGVEITALHWIYFYIVWFLPLVLIALFVDSPA